MKAVLMSIRPEWCKLIASGVKTVEIRKTRPRLETPFKVYIYESLCRMLTNVWTNEDYKSMGWTMEEGEKVFSKRTTGRGKVIGEFICDRIDDDYYHFDGDYVRREKGYPNLRCGSCMSVEQLKKYGAGKVLFGWNISGLKIYDKPKNLEEFNRPNVPGADEVDDLCNFCRATCGENLRCTEDLCLDAYRNYIQAYFMIKRPPQSWCYVEELEE